MRLIADSGSTKTDWCFSDNGVELCRVRTRGINPFHQDNREIARVISEELVPRLSVLHGSNPDEVFFYGAGCVGDKVSALSDVLHGIFPFAKTVDVETDMLGAARSLCGHKLGIACILGTGANSCLYDGVKIVANVPPLGYILGDEGSGAVLGKMFLNAIFKGDLSGTIKDLYLKETGYTYHQIINKVYREPSANRFLASASEFIGKHIGEHPELRSLVVDNFRNFFRKNVAKYNDRSLPVGAIGSVAYYYRDELEEAARAEGYVVGCVEKSPMNGLVRYHGSIYTTLSDR